MQRLIYILLLCTALQLALSGCASNEKPITVPASRPESVPEAGPATAATGSEQDKQTTFEQMRDEVLSYFTSLRGTVLSSADDRITSDITAGDGLKPGMRLRILRPGEAFVHPITGERVGQAEEPVGTAEAVEVTDEGSTFTVIQGEALQGDVLRLSSAPVQLLFFQSKDMEWSLAEEYFNILKSSERFDLLETAPGEPVHGTLISEANRLGAEAVLILSASGPLTRTIVRQRVIWASDGAELMWSDTELTKEAVEESRVGEEYFAPDRNRPTLGFTLPYSALLIDSGDLDGDGTAELLFSSGATVRAYTLGGMLTPALKGAELEGNIFETHIWLESHDLDGDGREEVIVSGTDGSNAGSYIYKYNGTSFDLLWEEDIFVRVVNGLLYGQRPGLDGGFRGSVYPVNWDESVSSTETAPLDLPKGVNIYDFTYIDLPDGRNAVLTYDASRHMVLHASIGEILWRSEENYGWPYRKFGERVVTDLGETEPWTVNDPITVTSGGALVLKRTPLSQSTPGFGNSSTDILALNPAGNRMEEATVIKDLPGGVADILVYNDQLFVLVNTSGIDPLKLIKGRGLFKTKVFIYMLRGE